MILYYPVVALVLLPWAMLFYGASRKMTLCRQQLQRLQWEGIALILADMLACWILFDRHWGLDPDESSRFAYWFARGETGFFAIGQLLLFMGYFLERRPRPGLPHWPALAKTATTLGILSGLALVLGMARHWSFLGLYFPWDASRIAWSLGLVPFAAAYLAEARRHSAHSLKTETLNITGEKQS